MGSNVVNVLEKWGSYMVELTRKRLTEGRKLATGNLIKSIAYRIKKDTKGNYELQLTGRAYLLNVDRGRGINKRRPPIKAIEAWIRYKNIPIKQVSQADANKALSKIKPTTIRGKARGQAIKQSTKTVDEQRLSMAFAIANKIAKDGIKPFPVLDVAAKIQSRAGYQRELQAAVKQDLIKQMNIIFK